MGEVVVLAVARHNKRVSRCTPKQRKALAFITGWRARYGGLTPSMRAIADAVGIGSELGAVRTVKALERAGLLLTLSLSGKEKTE